MAGYRLSAQADDRLGDIYEASILAFGFLQAERYVGGLHDTLRRLTDFPASGQACDGLLPGLRRYHYGRHTIYYRTEDAGIYVLDILHQAMLPERHLRQED